MLKYPLTEPLEACTEDEINSAFDYMDEWAKNSGAEFTLEMFYSTHPHFSGGESEVIFNSWKIYRLSDNFKPSTS